MRNLEEFNSAYKGQPALIIASGPSVFGLELDTLLKDKVTLAVNSGYVAMKTAKFFVSDDWSVANWSFFFKDLHRSPTTLALLYENKFREASRIFGERFVSFRHRSGYHVTGEYSHTNRANHILECRTSVGSAIHIAHIMGCDPIGLIGVDCQRTNGLRYFWQFDPARYGYPYRHDHPRSDGFRRIMHEGKQSDTDLVSILQYWKSFGGELNNKCRIFNLSPSTALDVFPKMSLEDFTREKYDQT